MAVPWSDVPSTTWARGQDANTLWGVPGGADPSQADKGVQVIYKKRYCYSVSWRPSPRDSYRFPRLCLLFPHELIEAQREGWSICFCSGHPRVVNLWTPGQEVKGLSVVRLAGQTNSEKATKLFQLLLLCSTFSLHFSTTYVSFLKVWPSFTVVIIFTSTHELLRF